MCPDVNEKIISFGQLCEKNLKRVESVKYPTSKRNLASVLSVISSASLLF